MGSQGSWGMGGPKKQFSENVFDDPLYIGRVEMRLNDGKKRKYLYFQSDYKIKRENEQPPVGGEQGEGGMIGTPAG